MFRLFKRKRTFRFCFTCDGKDVSSDVQGHIEDITEGIRVTAGHDEGTSNTILLAAAKILNDCEEHKAADAIVEVLNARFHPINN